MITGKNVRALYAKKNLEVSALLMMLRPGSWCEIFHKSYNNELRPNFTQTSLLFLQSKLVVVVLHLNLISLKSFSFFFNSYHFQGCLDFHFGSHCSTVSFTTRNKVALKKIPESEDKCWFNLCCYPHSWYFDWTWAKPLLSKELTRSVFEAQFLQW